MNNDNGKYSGDFEAVCEPALIRIEATFHPAPGFEYLETVPLGETEPCPTEPMISVQAELKPVAGSIHRFSVEEYHRLTKAGILTTDDKVELLEGWLVQKKSHNPQQDTSLQLMNEILHKDLPQEWCVRIRSAVTFRDSEPEPDVAVVRSDEGTRIYFARHPQANDIGMLTEIADATLLGDRADKGRIYARAGVPIYWIVNLIDQHIEVYEQPSGPTTAPAYAKTTTYRAGDSVPLVLDGVTVATFAVSDLLP